MKPIVRIYWLDEQGQRAFGEGPYRLLKGVEAEGSLRAAANSMQMAYSKALKILRRAEAALGFPLTCRLIGGRDGGGSQLTPEGRELIRQYEIYRSRCEEACRSIYEAEFKEIFQRRG